MATTTMTTTTRPPFPKDLPIAPLPRISLAALSRNDPKESLELFNACCDQGFFLLQLDETDNGDKVINGVEKAFDIGKEFFAKDLDTKVAFKVNSNNVGYKPLGLMKFKDGKTDLTEICAVSRDSIMDSSGSEPIPRVYQRERPQLQQMVNHVHPIAMLILKHLANHLDLPFSALEAMHETDSPSATVLRFLHNPPQKKNAMTDPKDVRQASLLGHTDSGSLTILFTEIGGLQILPSGADEDDESAWQWVRPEPGCAIINVGDPLVQWTGGILRSAFHRVLYAPGDQAGEERYSFGYFLKPADDAPMARLQLGNTIPKLSEVDVEEKLPHYELWHQDKTRKIMKGHQNGVFRGGVRPSPANKPIAV